MFVRELCNFMQLVTQLFKNKAHRKGFLLSGVGWVGAGLADPALWSEVVPFHHFDPTLTPCLLLGAPGVPRELAPAIINAAVTPRCLPGAL